MYNWYYRNIKLLCIFKMFNLIFQLLNILYYLYQVYIISLCYDII